MTDSFTYKPVTPGNWDDLEKFFESKGGPHHCWCMVWRKMDTGKKRTSKTDKKDTFKNYVFGNHPVGILCYDGTEAVAWCSVAPQETYRNFSNGYPEDHVWSLVCFFIKRTYRQKGLMKKLIQAAIDYSRKNGARYLEAYPVDADAPSYRFMGFRPAFERSGFEYIHKVGKRRNLMVFKL